MIGRTLGRYRILEQIGAGGMGVVYRARDQHLDRDVALKLLPAGTLADENARRRFRREAQALSRLNHPNIATVYDFDTQDGTDFLVLELIQGITLDERILTGALEPEKIPELGIQLAQGLEAAHQQGVVHRDLKPANLKLTSDGRLKILDFGLAQLVHPGDEGQRASALTETGVVVGTLAYMAPEQLSGSPVDARADIYAAGAVVYEMATGRRAFAQVTPTELIYAIVSETPVPPSSLASGLRPAFDDVILKALAKDPELRYQSAHELGADLERLAAGTRIAHPRIRHGVGWVPLAAAALLLVAVGLLWLDPGRWRERLLRGPQTGPIRSLAVLPLENLSGDPHQEYFADGMTEELITTLAKISALTVIARGSVMRFKGEHPQLAEIGRQLDVGAVVEGSVVRSGSRVRITAALVQVSTGSNLWTEDYERELSDVLALQGDVAQAIANQIQIRLSPRDRARLGAVPRVDPQAHEAYLRGRYAWNLATKEEQEKAIAFFKEAIRIDPSYALAYAGLADVYYGVANWWLPPQEAMPLARGAAERALALDPNLAEAHAVLGVLKHTYDWDLPGAEKEYRRAIELNPAVKESHLWYGLYLMEIGRLDQAQDEFDKTLRADPLDTYVRWHTTWPAFLGHRYPAALERATRLVALDPSFFGGYSIRGETEEFMGRYREAEADLKHALALNGNPWVTAALGRVYVKSGRTREAKAILRQLTTSKDYVSPYAVASLCAAFGHRNEAFAWLERGIGERSEDLLSIKIDPRMDTLHSDPRFAALVKRVGLGS